MALCGSYLRPVGAGISASLSTPAAAWTRTSPVCPSRAPTDDPENARMFAAVTALRAQGLDGRVLTAAETLFLEPIQPEVPGAVVPYINGRHRADAMLDAGVRHTVIGRWSDPGADR